MEEKIFKLIYDYFKANRMIDQKFIDKVIEIVVNAESLHKYVKETKYITDEELNEHSKKGWTIQIADASTIMDLSYDHENHMITVYTDNIPKIYDVCLNQMNFNNPKLACPSIYTQRILHEIEHGKQERTITEKDNLEAKILYAARPRVNNLNGYSAYQKAEEIVKTMIRTFLYYTNHRYSPMERMAEIDSYKRMKHILSLSKTDISDIIQYTNEMVLKNLIAAYDDKCLSPTIRFLKELCQYDNENPLNDFEWYSENDEECLKKSIEMYPFEQRIRCGLPIEKQKRLELINKFNNKVL